MSKVLAAMACAGGAMMVSDDDRLGRLVAALETSGVLETLVAEFNLDAAAIENSGGTNVAIARVVLAQFEGRANVDALDDALNRLEASSSFPPVAAASKRTVLVVSSDLRSEPDGEDVALLRRGLGDPGDFAVRIVRPASLGQLRDEILATGAEILHVTGMGSIEVGAAQALADEARSILGLVVHMVLIACPEGSVTEALAGAGRSVVSVNRGLGEKLTLDFVGGFYESLGQGLAFDLAFDRGLTFVEPASLPASLVPQFSSGLTFESVSPEIDFGEAHEVPIREIEAGETSAKGPLRYPLWFGTNRRPLDASDPSKGFGTTDDRRLHLGRCWVDVPESHRLGELGSSLLMRLWNRADDRLKLGKIVLEAEDRYWAGLGEALRQLDPGKRSAVVLVHGFNVSFRDAALRAAQLGVDLDVPGIMAFYSWPSHERMLRFGYQQDATAVQASEEHMAAYLATLANLDGVDSVHVIAHSMGNQGLIRSLSRVLDASASLGHAPFENIVLAAPDVDVRVFEALADAYARAARRTTLYASAKDQALRASTIMNDGDRAGFAPPLMIVEGIDTVDVTGANLSWLGHGEFAAARELLDDLKGLLVDRLAPKERGLRERLNGDGVVSWEIGPPRGGSASAVPTTNSGG